MALPDTKNPPFTELKPGDVVMHPRMFNRLCHLMKERRDGDGRTLIQWNNVAVHLDSNMPFSGWFIVPGTE